MREELDDTIRALAYRAARKGLRLTHVVAPTVAEHFVGDVGRLRQVLLNLVGNAIKFTSAGAVDVDVRQIEYDGEEAELAFIVRDTGIGIPADKQVVIFKAFAQQDTSTTRNYGGTGLGLTIAARLAGLMGGKITVASQPGQGSVFTFTARLRVTEQDTPADQEAASSAMVPTRSLRVLIAEDQEFNAQLLFDLMSRRGHRPFVAATGQDALRALDQAPFDLLLLDLHMPGLDGFGVIEEIRRRERQTGAHLPVIALTARSRQEDRERCLAAGMDEFLTKPIHGAAMAAAIERVVGDQVVLLDPSALIASCDDNPAIFTRVREALRRSIPGEVQALGRAVAAGDMSAVREVAHRLNGIVGAASTTVARVAGEIEDEAPRSTADIVGPRFVRLEALVVQLLSELEHTTIEELRDARRRS